MVLKKIMVSKNKRKKKEKMKKKNALDIPVR
jgi:hypothetical protein